MLFGNNLRHSRVIKECRPGRRLEQTRYIDLMLLVTWPTVFDAGPAINQHWANASFLLEFYNEYRYPVLYIDNFPVQNICITVVQCWTNVEDVRPTLYKCYTNVCVCWVCNEHSPVTMWANFIFIRHAGPAMTRHRVDYVVIKNTGCLLTAAHSQLWNDSLLTEQSKNKPWQ